MPRLPMFSLVLASALALGLTACAGHPEAPQSVGKPQVVNGDYLIGPGDTLQVFVWRNPELSMVVRVRPDGKTSVPLIEDVPMAGLTPTDAARLLEKKLSTFVKDPIVTVIMVDPIGTFDRQIRVVGEAAKPQSIPYRNNMTLLDVLIQTGGLTQYAAGNRATIVRTIDGKAATYQVRLADLSKDGDMSANVEMAPGDILTIPQSWF